MDMPDERHIEDAMTADRALLIPTHPTHPTHPTYSMPTSRRSGRPAYCGQAGRSHLFRLALRTPGLLLGDIASYIEADVPSEACGSSAHSAACLIHARP